MAQHLYLDDKYLTNILYDRSYSAILKYLENPISVKRGENNTITVDIFEDMINFIVKVEGNDSVDNVYAELTYGGKKYSLIKIKVSEKLARFVFYLEEFHMEHSGNNVEIEVKFI